MTEFERTFDNVAEDYDKVRPAYVRELYEDIFRYKPVNADSSILEIGIGTGRATLPFLKKNCAVTALEPGKSLAAAAMEKYRAYDKFFLYQQTFQDFACPPDSFDFIFSATAFHWIPEEYGYKRVYELLKKGGAFARFAYHAGADKGREALTAEIESLYQKYMGYRKKASGFCREDAAETARIAEKYGFSDISYQLYHVTKDFTADEYMMLLRTYPDHMKLEKQSRDRLFWGIYEAINRNGGIITVYYTMDLQMARKEEAM